jgi:predicted Zn finger-like uncharacterized protein
MPTIVTCPECGSKLRVPDGLAGQEVRCARCGETFVAPDIAPADVAPDPGQKRQPTDEVAFPAPPPRPAPVGDDLAFRLNLSLDDDPPAGSRPRVDASSASESEVPRPRPPALNDDHDDLQDCPRCGKSTHRDYARCPYCGLRLSRTGHERRPFLGRRDADPHRGGLVLTLGIIGLLGIVLCAPIGTLFGMVAWILGHSDLKRMKRGDMDPEGEGMTQAGWICGIIATSIGLLFSFGTCFIILSIGAAGAGQP